MPAKGRMLAQIWLPANIRVPAKLIGCQLKKGCQLQKERRIVNDSRNTKQKQKPPATARTIQQNMNVVYFRGADKIRDAAATCLLSGTITELCRNQSNCRDNSTRRLVLASHYQQQTGHPDKEDCVA
jgi:hypothetical protein